MAKADSNSSAEPSLDIVTELTERQRDGLRNTALLQKEIRAVRLRSWLNQLGLFLWKAMKSLQCGPTLFLIALSLLVATGMFMLVDLATGLRTVAVGAAAVTALVAAVWQSLLFFRRTPEQLRQFQQQLDVHLKAVRRSATESMSGVLDLSNELTAARESLGQQLAIDNQRGSELAKLYMENWAEMDEEQFRAFIRRALRVQGYRPDRSFRGDANLDFIFHTQDARLAIRLTPPQEVAGPDDVEEAIDGAREHVCHACVMIAPSTPEEHLAEAPLDMPLQVIGCDGFRDFMLGRKSLVPSES